MARPIRLLSLRVSKTTMDIVRFEGELANRQDLKQLIDRMDTAIKLQGNNGTHIIAYYSD